MARTTTTDILNTKLTLDGSDYTSGMKHAEGELKGFEKKSTLSLRKLGIGIASATAAMYAMKKAFDFGREGARIAQLENAFKRLGGTLQPLRDAVRNTVDDQTLIQMTNMANLLNINQREFEELAKIAKAYADTAGVDVKYAVESIVVGVARQSRLMLDNVGIIVKVEDANKAMAESLGTTIAKLTGVEKRQAFMNATLKAGAVIIGKAGQEGSVVDGYDRMAAGFTNAINDMKKSASTLPRELYEFFFDSGAWLRRARAAQGSAVGEDSFMGKTAAEKRAAKIIADRTAAQVAANTPLGFTGAEGAEISGLGAFLMAQQAETKALLETQQAGLDARVEVEAISQEARIAALAANYDMEQEMAIASGQRLIEAQTAHLEAEGDIATARETINARLMGSYMMLASNAGSAISALTGSQRVGFIIQRGIAASIAWINGMAGAASAIAPPPIGAGPIVGLALSKKLALLTKLNVAAIAATSFGGKGGGGGTSSYSYGGASMSVPTQSAQAAPQVKVYIKGSGLENMIESINTIVEQNDVELISTRSFTADALV